MCICSQSLPVQRNQIKKNVLEQLKHVLKGRNNLGQLSIRLPTNKYTYP